MQKFQTRRTLAIVKAKFSAKILLLTSRCMENKMDPRLAGLFCCCVEQTAI